MERPSHNNRLSADGRGQAPPWPPLAFPDAAGVGKIYCGAGLASAHLATPNVA